MVFVPVFSKIPLAPLDGAVKVTCVPLTGVPMLSRTTAVSGKAAISFGTRCWSPPPTMVICAAGPGAVYSYAPMSHVPTLGTSL